MKTFIEYKQENNLHLIKDKEAKKNFILEIAYIDFGPSREILHEISFDDFFMCMVNKKRFRECI